ncbi:MAG: cupin domain-containing protein [Thermoleophilia bacterium]|nr:cupin domain-containing protein [Thermoleophilia bacterium]
MIAHWDDLEAVGDEAGHLASDWRDLGRAAGSRAIGVKRVDVRPGRWGTPVHQHTGEEEIGHVLAGDGLVWIGGRTHAVGAGTAVVFPAGGPAHAFRAGPDGLSLLMFGIRGGGEVCPLPRAGVAWVGDEWVELPGGREPWDREAALGPPECPPPEPPPACVVRLEDAPAYFDGQVHALGQAGGAELAGLNHVVLTAGAEGAPPHHHSAEEELFVLLAGSATLSLSPTPARAATGAVPESHALRAGHVVARLPGSGMCHVLRAGPEGVVYLAYGTRVASEMTYYPGSGEVYLRAVGVLAAVERPLPRHFMPG